MAVNINKLTNLIHCVNNRHLLLAASRGIYPSCRYSNQNIPQYDIVVVGGGIVGAASARELVMRHPHLKLAILEKESNFARHQTGNNSGVVHAGIYYKTGSLKAKLCVKGAKLLRKYCEEKNLKYIECGKLIVATEKNEIPRLLDLYDRGIQNGVEDLKLVDNKEMREIEPLCQGIQGIWSPHTAIVDYAAIARSYVEDIVARGGTTYLNFEVNKFEDADSEYPVILSNGKDKTVAAKYVLTCCGLYSDKVAVLTGCSEDPKIIPFRGEYLYVKKENSNLAKTNIYPVPDPRFPFLGVHVTPRVDGRIILGPNAILAFSKEGYRWSDINFADLKEIMSFSGFRKLAMKYASFGLKEMVRSIITPLQVRSLQKFIKEIKTSNVERGIAGVRAQAMAKDGTLIEDFVFDSQAGAGSIGKRVLHCRNAPSPGATSSLAIGAMIADKMEEEFKLKN